METPLRFFRTVHLDFILTAERDVHFLEAFLTNGSVRGFPLEHFMKRIADLYVPHRLRMEDLASGDSPEFAREYTYHFISRLEMMQLFEAESPPFLAVTKFTEQADVDAVKAWVAAAPEYIIAKSFSAASKSTILSRDTDFTDEKITERGYCILQHFIQSKFSCHHEEEPPDRLFAVRQSAGVFYNNGGISIMYIPPLVRVAIKKLSDGVDNDSCIANMNRGCQMRALDDEQDEQAINIAAKAAIQKFFLKITNREQLAIAKEEFLFPDGFSITKEEAEGYVYTRAARKQPKTIKLELNPRRAVSNYKGIKEEPA